MLVPGRPEPVTGVANIGYRTLTFAGEFRDEDFAKGPTFKVGRRL